MKHIGYYFAVYAVVLLVFGSLDFIPAGLFAVGLIGLGMVMEEL